MIFLLLEPIKCWKNRNLSSSTRHYAFANLCPSLLMYLNLRCKLRQYRKRRKFQRNFGAFHIQLQMYFMLSTILESVLLSSIRRAKISRAKKKPSHGNVSMYLARSLNEFSVQLLWTCCVFFCLQFWKKNQLHCLGDRLAQEICARWSA